MKISKNITKKEAEIITLKQKIETEHKTLDQYVAVLMKYAEDNIDVCSGSIYFMDLHDKILVRVMHYIENSSLPAKKKETLRREFMWGPRADTEKEQLQHELKYIEDQVKQAMYLIRDLDAETKKKIIEDGIRAHVLWTNLFIKEIRVDKVIGKTKRSPKSKQKKSGHATPTHPRTKQNKPKHSIT